MNGQIERPSRGLAGRGTTDVAPARELQVPSQLSQLRHLQEQLAGAVGELRSRLQPVSRTEPQPPQPEQEKVPSGSSVMDQLALHMQVLESITVDVREMIRLLEV